MSDGYIPATPASACELAPQSNSSTCAQIVDIVQTILEVCPKCLVKKRNDDALIFVPCEFRNRSTNKNLMTVWPTTSKISKIRIMRDPEQVYSPQDMPAYKERLRDLYSRLLLV